VFLEKRDVYMYKLNISDKAKRELFLGTASETQKLKARPRFYNTLTGNCTNTLAKHAFRVNKDALPLYSMIVLPGYSDRLLYRLGYIENSRPLEEVKEGAKLGTSLF